MGKSKTTPRCPGCGASFAHSQAACRCIKCGLPDEVIARGRKALDAWKRSQGFNPRPSTSNRRKRAHGRPRGRSRLVRSG